jgi:choline-sulfatase
MAFMSSRPPSLTGCYGNLSELPSDVPTFAHAFLAAGYETVLAGRMHFVGFDQRHGFEQRIIGDVWPSAHLADGYHLDEVLGPLADTAGSSPATLIKSGAGRTGYHAYDEAVCRTAVAWLEERRRSGPGRRPFLLMVGLISPHCPLVAPAADFARYRERIAGRAIPDPDGRLLHPTHRAARERFATVSEAEVARSRAAYFGLITYTDRQVGRIIEAARANDAVVVYTSDHGEMMGEHGLWGKNTCYEGSVGVPFVLSSPGRFRPAVMRRPISLLDVGPTLLAIAGVDPLPGAAGRSFAALLAGGGDAWPDEVFAEYAAEAERPSPQRMVRSGSWKYIYHHDAAPQLFNLEDDPDEIDDRSGDPSCRPTLDRLQARALADWDPRAIAARLRERRSEQRLIATWTERMELWEPDAIWHERPPANVIDPS